MPPQPKREIKYLKGIMRILEISEKKASTVAAKKNNAFEPRRNISISTPIIVVYELTHFR